MLQFCEAPAGLEGQVCGSRPLGKCYSCGRLVCKTHSRVLKDKLFCWDCSPVDEFDRPPEKEPPPQPEISPAINEEDSVLLEEPEPEVSASQDTVSLEEIVPPDEEKSIWDV